MIVAWNYIMLKEVDNEEEAFREIRRFIDANQLPAQTVTVSEGFTVGSSYMFFRKGDSYLQHTDEQLFSCKQVCVEPAGIYGLPSPARISSGRELEFLIWYENDRSKLQALYELKSKEKFMKHHKPFGHNSEFELSRWREEYELLYSMLENYLKDRAAEKEAQKCH